MPKDPSPQGLGEELVGGIVAVDEMLDLLIRHAGALLLAQAGFLLQSPLVDELRVLGIDVDEGVELVGNLIVGLERRVYGLDVGEGVVAEAAVVARRVSADGFRRGFPFLAQGGLPEGTESDGPTFEEDDFYGGPVGLVDDFPVGLWDAVALAREGGFVVLWDGGRLRFGEGREDGESEGDVVGRGLAAVLEESVVWMGLGEGGLVGVGEVEVVEGEDGGGEMVGWGLEGRLDEGDLGSRGRA